MTIEEATDLNIRDPYTNNIQNFIIIECAYNKNVGTAPKQINTIDFADLHWTPTELQGSLGWAPVGTLLPWDRGMWEAGSTFDPPVIQGLSALYNRQLMVMSRTNILPDATSTGYNSGRVESGRQALSNAAITNQLTFSNGTWNVSGSASFGFSANQYVSHNIATYTELNVVESDTCVYPFSNGPRIGLPAGGFMLLKPYGDWWELDMDEFEIVDPNTGCFAIFAPHNVNFPYDNSNPDFVIHNSGHGYEWDYQDVSVYDWNSPFRTIDGIGGIAANAAVGRHQNPSYLGTCYVTFTLEPTGGTDTFTEFVRWNCVSESFLVSGLPGYSKISTPAQISALGASTAPVTIDD